MFRRSQRGVTDVPLELVIIIIILAIVIPVILAAFVSFTREQELTSLDQQANNVLDTAIQVFDDGLNTTLLVSVNIPTSGGASLTIGAPLFSGSQVSGTPDVYSTFINYSISGASPYPIPATNNAQSIYMTGMTCGTGGVIGYPQVLLSSGSWTVSMTKLGPGATYCSVQMQTTFLEVSVYR